MDMMAIVIYGVSISNCEFCTLSKTEDLTDFTQVASHRD